MKSPIINRINTLLITLLYARFGIYVDWHLLMAMTLGGVCGLSVGVFIVLFGNGLI